jgi:hypothetical protein
MRAKDGLELNEQIVRELDNSLVGWKRHLILLVEAEIFFGHHRAANRRPLRSALFGWSRRPYPGE